MLSIDSSINTTCRVVASPAGISDERRAACRVCGIATLISLMRWCGVRPRAGSAEGEAAMVDAAKESVALTNINLDWRSHQHRSSAERVRTSLWQHHAARSPLTPCLYTTAILGLRRLVCPPLYLPCATCGLSPSHVGAVVVLSGSDEKCRSKEASPPNCQHKSSELATHIDGDG